MPAGLASAEQKEGFNHVSRFGLHRIVKVRWVRWFACMDRKLCKTACCGQIFWNACVNAVWERAKMPVVVPSLAAMRPKNIDLYNM